MVRKFGTHDDFKSVDGTALSTTPTTHPPIEARRAVWVTNRKISPIG